jgi:hypothetical protein
MGEKQAFCFMNHNSFRSDQESGADAAVHSREEILNFALSTRT